MIEEIPRQCNFNIFFGVVRNPLEAVLFGIGFESLLWGFHCFWIWCLT